jgi:hypothetical protein
VPTLWTVHKLSFVTVCDAEIARFSGLEFVAPTVDGAIMGAWCDSDSWKDGAMAVTTKKCLLVWGCAAVFFAGCGRAERPAVEAPAHFAPLPSHPPTALNAPPVSPKKSGTTDQRSESVRPKGVGSSG